MPLLVSLLGIGVVFLALGTYVLTSVQRQMRAARNRVSFAGQVSHELRTPLTNIRLYAELAEADLKKIPASEARQSIEKRLAVIDSESRRLGRLVSGVLEMIRDDVKHRAPHLSLHNADELIDQTLQQFAPSFENAGIVVGREALADDLVNLDADIFEMVLVNLLSNVEKYAAEGGRVDITSRLEDEQLIVTVADQGQGIAARHRRNIFRPFSRVDDSINAPGGTGIGLTIARRAARRHGGDLTLLTTERGACFEFRIPAPQ
jgi:signal transduction histidine kinase